MGLERIFGIRQRGSTVATEIRAGVTTFLTMAYILVVNPAILADAGMPPEDVAIATALASALATLVMGLFANFPFALAPGMGLNAYFTYTVVIGMEIPWQGALAAVLAEGVIFMILSFGGIRTLLLDAIPRSLKEATTLGIGVFLAFIGLKNAGLVVADPATLVALGDLRDPQVLLATVGLVACGALMVRRVRGGILLTIVLLTVCAWWLRPELLPERWATVPSLPRETLFAVDFDAVATGSFVGVVIALLFVDLFDTAGTLIGIGTLGGFVDDDGKLPGSDRAFFADALGTTAGALLGTSTVTSYIESGSGVDEGGRTGLTAVVVALLFVAALFLTPAFAAVPVWATAPALVVVGATMMASARRIVWDRLEEGIPAFLCVVVMPLTFNIANGIAAGIVAHVGLFALGGRWREVHPVVAVVAVALVVYRLSGFAH